ncbi:ADP-ribosylation factor GTPase-activating protein AGD2 [Hibiscus syriacus]|uniref:ADP-ribosylation factor GTPase-activating protein AGD2 n=1 Tax=Hibiscus syriacus TaxID=106335 RepID=A0A6A3C645_HIBSY|nr:ADP-ribosylation factor GTPase-activating protein AGD4-like isoform X2 [Hibiscus syriacus]KAE8724573.1 ADP-ribosylation factor GTPase-activating protein AGD2 [Hibiscus syriacus]
MAAFIKLEDSPMFQKQICSLESMADELKSRCQMLTQGSITYRTALGEAYNADNSFADSLEVFGCGQDDPISASIGGPVMSKFINAFRELASYKELLCSQVEHVLIDRLMHFTTVDLQDAKEARQRFDKARTGYAQAREKFVSLKKNTPEDIVVMLEEDLENSKSAFERNRFNLVNSLMNIEAKKKYEFLESISAIMDGHLRYFKLGYELLNQLEPFIHQVLTYAQQAKELANAEKDTLEKRIQEFRTQAEIDALRASGNIEPSTSTGGIHVIGKNTDKNIEAIMQSFTNGEVEIIKQGYLLKRPSSLRGDWKRRFFVLDSQGTLYYYRNKGIEPMGSLHQYAGSAEHNSGVFSRFRANHNRSSSFNEEALGYRPIDLRISTIKMDAEDTDLRLCFRIISPLKTYTLQAENGADRMDWVNKITAVITSLFNYRIRQQLLDNNDYTRRASSNARSSKSLPPLGIDRIGNRADPVFAVFREVPGNDVCAECNAPEPDWASLNLGILFCIECSGVHRNLGVHISKVRSLTLDVKVWEPSIVELFRSLGNVYCNSVWEGSLLNERVDESNALGTSITKPCSKDPLSHREKYVYAKYVEKLLIVRDAMQHGDLSNSANIWQAVESDKLREVYRLIAISDTNIVKTSFDDVFTIELYHHVVDAQDSSHDINKVDKREQYDPSTCPRIKDSNEPRNCLQGCSILHLACQYGNPAMVELLLQFGADINMRDFHGRTPLQHCISKGNNQLAKLLLRRGALSTIKDGGGLSALERAMEKGAITDDELFVLLSEVK